MCSCQPEPSCCCCCDDPCQRHDPCRSQSTPCRTRGKSYRNKCVPHCGVGKTECYCNAVCVVCDRKTRVNNAIYTEQMKSGYMGHVPLSQYYLGLSFPEAAILGVAEFECSRNRRRQCRCANNCNNNAHRHRPCAPKFPAMSPVSDQKDNLDETKIARISGFGMSGVVGKFDLNLKPRNYAGYAGWRYNCATAPKTKEMAELAKAPENREKGIDCYLCPCPVPCACSFPCCCPCPCPPPPPHSYPCCHSCCVAQVPRDRSEEKENISPSKDVATQVADHPPTPEPVSEIRRQSKRESIKKDNGVEADLDGDEKLKKVCAYPCPSPCCPSVMPCFPCSKPCSPYPHPCPCPCACPTSCCPPPCSSSCGCPCPYLPCLTCPCPGSCCPGSCCPGSCCPSSCCPGSCCPGSCCPGSCCPGSCGPGSCCPGSCCPGSCCPGSCGPCGGPCGCPCGCPMFCCCGPSMKNYETCPTPPPKPLKIYFTESKNQTPCCDPPSICPPCCCYVPCPQPCCVVEDDHKNRSNNSNEDCCEAAEAEVCEVKQYAECTYLCPEECDPPYPCARAPGIVCACPCYPDHPSQMILTRHPPNTLPITCCSCCKPSEPLNAGLYPKLAANTIAQWSLLRQRTISFLPTTNKTCCLPHDPNKNVYAGCERCCRCSCYIC